MEFGKLDDLSFVDWALPKDDSGNSKRLTPNNEFKLYFGSPAWGNKIWTGKLYPPKTKPNEFLYHYSRSFNSVELNTTHYRIPNSDGVKEWLSLVPKSFEFCPKVNKEISHARNGLLDKTTFSYWLTFLERMQGNLGPCFIQFHEMFSYSEKAQLFQFLENWPSEFKLTLELRHQSWFREGIILPALTDYLHKKNIGLVITDVAGRRDVLHSSLSTDWTMIRLIGNDLDLSDEKRLADWQERILAWKKMGLKKVYFFLHQPDDVLTVEFAQLAQEIFEKAKFCEVPKIQMIKEQTSLI